jgi:hypothetical protein
MSLLKSNFDNSVENIRNSTNFDFLSIKSPVVIAIATLFFIAILMMLYKYKFKFSIEKKDSKIDGTLLISEPTELSPEIKICKKGIDISENAEHSYSFWIFVKDWNSSAPENKIIFFRRYDERTMVVTLNTTDSTLNIVFLNRNQRLYINNSVRRWDKRFMNNNNIEMYTVKDFYLQRWNHVVISQWGKNMDLFINGKLIRSFTMNNELRTTSVRDFRVGGHEMQTFRGLISRFKYHIRTLSVHEVYTLYTHGPSNNNAEIIPVKKLAKLDFETV